MAPESQEQNPYVGPRPFERQDRDRFFGREREASEVLSLVIAHRVLLLYAQSGAGKTSLINAGLIPLLEKERFEVLPLARLSGPIPATIEPEEIPNLYVFNTLTSWAGEEAGPKRLVKMSLASFLKEREHLTDEEGLSSPRLIIFDQFEELFAFYQDRWQDREGFFEQVRDALEKDPLLRVVFVMREDYIAQLDPYASHLPEKLRIRFRLERLRKDAALAAIKEPLGKTDRSFAEGVAEQLVEDLLKVRGETAAGKTEVVTGEFVEPVQLQVVCQSLWQGLLSGITEITQDHLQAFGDVNQALSEFYERCIEETAQETGIKEEDLRTWFERELITPVGTRKRVYRGREETGGIPNAAVKMLGDLHLIKREWWAGAQWYELTHDRFIEPIQESNKTWRERKREERAKKRRNVLIISIIVVAALVGILIRVTIHSLKTAQTTALGSQETAEAAVAVGVTATQAATEATVAAQETATAMAQAEKTVAAQETATAQAEATVAAQETAAAQAEATISAQETATAQAEATISAQETATAQAEEILAAEATARAQAEATATASAQKEIEARSFLADADQSKEQGDYEQAIADCNRAIELVDDLAEAYYKRGFIYTYHLNEYEKAIAEYDRAIELEPEYKWAYAHKGHALRKLGRYDEALAALSQAIQLVPEYAWAYRERGETYSDLGEYELAIEEYDKAIKLDPEYKYAYAHKGSDLRKLGRYDEALAALNQAIQLDPEYAWPYTERGNVYSDLGKYERAIEEYDKAIALDPEYKWAYGNKGYALRKLGRYDEARAALDQTIQLDPEYVDAYYEQGRVYSDLEEYERAIEGYDKVIELDAEYAYAFFYRGSAYKLLGETEKAIADFEEFLKLSKDENLRSQAEQYLKELGGQ